MSDPKFDELERLERREKVSSFYCRKKTIRWIAKELECSISTIHSDLEWVREEWKNSAVSNMEARKSEMLAELDEVKRVAWDAWNDSRGRKERETSGGKFGATTTSWYDAGDKRFFDAIMEAFDKQCKILGIYAAQESKITHGFERMGDEEFAEFGRSMGLESPRWKQRMDSIDLNGHTNGNGNGHKQN